MVGESFNNLVVILQYFISVSPQVLLETMLLKVLKSQRVFAVCLVLLFDYSSSTLKSFFGVLSYLLNSEQFFFPSL